MSASIKVTLPNGLTATHDFTGMEGASIHDTRAIPDSFWYGIADLAGMEGHGIGVGVDRLLKTGEGHTFVNRGKCTVYRAVQTGPYAYDYVRGPRIDCDVEIVTTYEAF